MLHFLSLRCKLCDMDYKYHMMTKGCIRIHAMTHLRKYIHQEMLMNQSQTSSSSSHKHDGYTCYICGVRDNKPSYIINHLGVYHKRLDFYNDFSWFAQKWQKASSGVPLPHSAHPLDNYLKKDQRNIINSAEEVVKIIEPSQVYQQPIRE